MKQLGGLHVKIWWVAILSHVKLGGYFSDGLVQPPTRSPCILNKFRRPQVSHYLAAVPATPRCELSRGDLREMERERPGM